MLEQSTDSVNNPFADVDEINKNGVFVDIRPTARTCLALGLSVVPVKADGSKTPHGFWKWLQYERLYEDNIARAFLPGQGIALIGGTVSGNLEILDFDSWEVWLSFEALARASGYGELIDRMTSGYFERSPNGAHLPYRCEEIAGNQKLAQRADEKAMIETRGEGGYVIIAPTNGTVHPSGKPYVLESGSLATIPTITPQERNDLFLLARTFHDVAEEPKTERRDPQEPHNTGDRPGDLFNARATWNEVLEPPGWKRIYEHNGVTYWRRPGKERGVSATTNYSGSGLFYCFSTSTEFDAERGYSKFSAYTRLNHGGDFTQAAEALLRAGYSPHTANGSTPPPKTDWQGAYTPKSNGLALTPLCDLLNEPEEKVSWLVEGMLPSAGFSLVVAKPKTGKSTLARNLALAVATGRDFLGKKTQKGPVIYLALEEKRAEVRKHFLAMGATGEEEIFLFAASAPADALPQIRAAIAEKKPVLLIIDPLFRLTRVKDGNDYAQVTAALEPLLSMARETGAHVSCMHHLGKGGDREGGDAILGSTAIFAAVDTALIMKRSERYRTVSSIQRYGEDLAETVLRFDAQKRTTTLGESKEQEEEQRLAEAIMEFLKNQKEPVTEEVINAEVEGRRIVRRRALLGLLKIQNIDGPVVPMVPRVERTGKGGKKDPFKYTLYGSCFSWSHINTRTMGPSTDLEQLSPQKGTNDSWSRGPSVGQDSEKTRDHECSASNAINATDTETSDHGAPNGFHTDARDDDSPRQSSPWQEEEI